MKLHGADVALNEIEWRNAMLLSMNLHGVNVVLNEIEWRNVDVALNEFAWC